MAKLRVAVIYGGPSSEHDVSVSSGKAILAHIDRQKYEIVEVFVSRSGKWSIDHQTEELPLENALEQLKKLVDVVFLGLHGTFGEDGHVQEALDKAQIPYTGSGAKASKDAFDKAIAQDMYEQAGLKVPKWDVISSASQKSTIEIPLVVKPVSEGSSVGVSIVRKPSELGPAIETAFSFADKVMLQEYIDGVEVSCGVIEDSAPKALTPTELRPLKDDFFSYEAKYEEGGTDELTPPELPTPIIEKIKDISIKAHEVLGCRGYSRTDMFVNGAEIYIIETNTLPGFTPTSILPQEAEYDHISYAKLLDILINQARHD